MAVLSEKRSSTPFGNRMEFTEGEQGRFSEIHLKCKELFYGDIIDVAARMGLLDSIKWLVEIGHPPDQWTMAFAAAHGHLTIVQWLRERDCPWTTLSTTWAAGHSSLEVLKWLLTNGCPYPNDLAETSRIVGHPRVADWMEANGF